MNDRLFTLACVTALLILFVVVPASADSPPTGQISAQETEPNTVYTADVTDPDGDTLSFTWTGQVACGTFTPASPSPDKATWNHPNGQGCEHDPSLGPHEGSIAVEVADGTGWVVRCEYDGSESGTGDPCDVAMSPSPTSTPTDGLKCPGYENDPRPQIVGTDAPETLSGTEEEEIICGLGGADTLSNGNGGADEILGGAGPDTITSGLSAVTIFGNGGRDTITLLYTSFGRPHIYGGPRRDEIQGSGRPDVIEGGGGPDVIDGGAGRNEIYGLSGNDNIRGGFDKDEINGGRGADTIRGGEEIDTLSGGPGVDRIFGGEENDTIMGDEDPDKRLEGGPGIDTIRGGDDEVRDDLFGGPDRDFLYGGPGGDVLKGEEGDDDLFGQLGTDLLDGGPDTDYCEGGTGLDTFLRTCETQAP